MGKNALREGSKDKRLRAGGKSTDWKMDTSN